MKKGNLLGMILILIVSMIVALQVGARSLSVYSGHMIDGPLRLSKQITTSGYCYMGSPSFSPDGGKIVYRELDTAANMSYICEMNSDGSNRQVLFSAPMMEDICDPVLSPTGTRIVFGKTVGIWVMNSDGTGITPLITFPAWGYSKYPSWSPDGNKILFVGVKIVEGIEVERGLFVMNSDGTGVTNLVSTTAELGYSAYSPDGSKIIYVERLQGIHAPNIVKVNSDGTGRVLLTCDADGILPVWWGRITYSPDGQYILYPAYYPGTTYDDWNFWIWRMRADGTDKELYIGKNGDTTIGPAYSPDGNRIAFVDSSGYDIWIVNPNEKISLSNLTRPGATDIAIGEKFELSLIAVEELSPQGALVNADAPLDLDALIGSIFALTEKISPGEYEHIGTLTTVEDAGGREVSTIAAIVFTPEIMPVYAPELLTVITAPPSPAEALKIEVQKMEDLKGEISTSGIVIARGLNAKLDASIDSINRAILDITEGRYSQAINMINGAQNQLGAFVNMLSAQSGKKIPEELAQKWLQKAEETITQLEKVKEQLKDSSPKKRDVSAKADLNADGKVDEADLEVLKKAFNSKPGDANWNPQCDLNGDGKVNLGDFGVLVEEYNK